MIKVKEFFKKISKFMAVWTLFSLSTVYAAEITILNVSYDPTREFYRAYNEIFAKHYNKLTDVEQSRREQFVEQFSQIDANTFHKIPCFSMPWIQPSQPDGEISHEIQTYCDFIDGVMEKLIGPLRAVHVTGKRKLVIEIE
jgi:hypothetical protein